MSPNNKQKQTSKKQTIVGFGSKILNFCLVEGLETK